MSSPDFPAPGESRLVRHSRREAILVTALFLFALAWTMIVTRLLGGRHDQFTLGFPSWVFWGVLVPWVTCAFLSVAFALAGMSDDALEEPLASETNAASPNGRADG